MAAYLQNRLPGTSSAGKTPFELLYGIKPSITHVRTFGAPAYGAPIQRQFTTQ